MKNIFQNILKTTIICLLLVLSSCEKDLYDEAIIQQSRATSEKISINQVLSEINSPLIKEYINNELRQELNFSQSKSSEDYFTFMKIIKQDSYTTYSLLLNVYTAEKPYFKFFIITKEGITEKAGYFKYTPDNNEPIFNAEDLNGKVQVLDVENNVKGETIFISSQPQSPPIGTDMIDCVDTYDVITHNCTNGDNHPPGVPCNNGNVNDGYYEVVVITTCTSTSDYYHIAPPIDFMGASTIVGGGDMLSINLNVLQYIFSLNDEQYSILQQCPSLVTYLENNDSSPESNNLVTWAINSILFNINTNAFINEAFSSLNANEEVDFSKNIIYGINKPCQKQIVKDIIDVCSPFTELIQQTFDSSDKVNIKFSNEVGLPGNGNTSPVFLGTPQNFTIKIKFDNHFLDNSTDLGIVAVTLHELVHAYLISLYLKGTLVATNSDYNTLLNAFIAFYNNEVQDTFDVVDNEIHNAMKDFISNMGNSIYNYALNKNINVTPDYCEKLAWGTMSGYDLFTQTLTSEQQIENNNIYAYEQDNILPQAKGTPCD